jgi:hypothetical protein
MGALGLRLLKLQQEFAERELHDSTALEFAQAGWEPRSEQEIAADYEAALLELVRSADRDQ